MAPGPAPTFDPDDIPYFFDTWCSLSWTPWVPFTAGKYEFRIIPKEPGLYRIRPVGKDFLMYIGETGRPLHRRLNDLRMELRNRDLMPWSEPHIEAPGLWAWSDWSESQENERDPQDPPVIMAGRYEYECSATPLDASQSGRHGMEAFLLYRYRQERGRSTICNFGRFHPRYRKSTGRKEGMRGGRLAGGQRDNPAGWPGTEPLEVTAKPGDRNWMGLEWTAREPLAAENVRKIAAGAGLYLLADTVSQEVVHIGQSADVAGRLLDLSRESCKGKTLEFSYQIIGQSVLPHHLKELENDLIGNYYENFRKAPEFQFRNSR